MPNKIVSALVLLILSQWSCAEGVIEFENRGDIQSSDCFGGMFGDYTAWRDEFIKRKYNTQDDKAKAVARFDYLFPQHLHADYKAQLECSWIEYPVDGGLVSGYVIRPKNLIAKAPVIIYNRGGNLNYGRVFFGSLYRRQFAYAMEGFIVMGTQYRGVGREEHNPDFTDQFGGDDVNDVLALMDLIPHIKNADPARVGMMGSSRGAIQTLLAIKAGANIKAAAVIAGVYDIENELAWRPEMEGVFEARIPNYAADKTNQLKQRSALYWLDELDKAVPILIMHGQRDTKTNPINSLKLALGLQEQGHPYKLVTYPNGDHGLRKDNDDVNRLVIEWMQTYL